MISTNSTQSTHERLACKILFSDSPMSGVTAPTEEADDSLSEPWALIHTNALSGRNLAMPTSADEDYEPWSCRFTNPQISTSVAISCSETVGHPTSTRQHRSILSRLASWVHASCSSQSTCHAGIISPLLCLLGGATESTSVELSTTLRGVTTFQESFGRGSNSWYDGRAHQAHPGTDHDCVFSSVGFPIGPDSKSPPLGDRSRADPSETHTSDPSLPILYSRPDAFHARATEVEQIQFARPDIDHIASCETVRNDLFTKQSTCPTGSWGENFQAGCIAFLKAVRDVAIPPCLFFSHQRSTCCVFRHNTSRVPETRHMTSQFNRSKQAPIFWYAGSCKSGDHHIDFQALQHTTISRGAVPELTTTEKHLQKQSAMQTRQYNAIPFATPMDAGDLNSITTLLRRFTNASSSWLPLAQSNTAMPSSVGIQDTLCPLVATRTDIDQCKDSNFFLSSSVPSPYITPGISPCAFPLRNWGG